LIGDGKNQVDMTYVDNVVEATRLALITADVPAGQRLNITNDAPVVNYELIDRILKGLGFSYRKKHLSFQKAYGAAAVFEWIGRLSGREPIITKYGVCALSKTRTLNIDLAKSILGYRPLVSVDEGVQRTLQWLN
jgi:nucleoside-diphosphate-sugar epimerase